MPTNSINRTKEIKTWIASQKTQKDLFNLEYQPVQRELPFPKESAPAPMEYNMKSNGKANLPPKAKRLPKLYRNRAAIARCWNDPLFSAANAEGLIAEILPELERSADYIRDNCEMFCTEAFLLDDRFQEVPKIVARILVTGHCSFSIKISGCPEDLPAIAYRLILKMLRKIIRSQSNKRGWDPTLAM